MNMNVFEKRKVINLIRFFSEDDKESFKKEAMEIAKYLNDNGDNELALYIRGLLSDANIIMPQ